MNASEARELSAKAPKVDFDAWRESINALIKDAAKKGNRSIVYRHALTLSEQAQKKLMRSLEDDGYMVLFIDNPDPGHPANIPYYRISW